MRSKPILFSGPMVRALLADQKTQTRRVVKPQPRVSVEEASVCPYGAPGDRLWVRETHYIEPGTTAETWDRESEDEVVYRADGEIGWADEGGMRWRPSIHMPRWASRITLEVMGVRVERLQEISEEDAKAEGIQAWIDSHKDGPDYHPNSKLGSYPVTAFARLWDLINGERRGCSWDENPWVWAVSFRREVAA